MADDSLLPPETRAFVRGGLDALKEMLKHVKIMAWDIYCEKDSETYLAAMALLSVGQDTKAEQLVLRARERREKKTP